MLIGDMIGNSDGGGRWDSVPRLVTPRNAASSTTADPSHQNPTNFNTRRDEHRIMSSPSIGADSPRSSAVEQWERGSQPGDLPDFNDELYTDREGDDLSAIDASIDSLSDVRRSEHRPRALSHSRSHQGSESAHIPVHEVEAPGLREIFSPPEGSGPISCE